MNKEEKNFLKTECQKIRQQYVLEEQRRIERKKSEITRREKTKKALKKIKMRTFNKKNILIGSFASIILLTSGCTNNEDMLQKKAIKTLNFEVEVHGGAESEVDARKFYNLSEHLASENCAMPYDGTAFEDRIEDYCTTNNLPDCVKVAAIEKFHYYMNNSYFKGNSIDLVNIYNKYNKNPNENIKLLNGDEIIIDNGIVVYEYNEKNEKGLSR